MESTYWIAVGFAAFAGAFIVIGCLTWLSEQAREGWQRWRERRRARRPLAGLLQRMK